ncbi:hypothetical protein ROZALSC1DRAFT_31988, partial [Rozella allomycis CSF55]
PQIGHFAQRNNIVPVLQQARREPSQRDDTLDRYIQRSLDNYIMNTPNNYLALIILNPSVLDFMELSQGAIVENLQAYLISYSRATYRHLMERLGWTTKRAQDYLRAASKLKEACQGHGLDLLLIPIKWVYVMTNANPERRERLLTTEINIHQSNVLRDYLGQNNIGVDKDGHFYLVNRNDN